MVGLSVPLVGALPALPKKWLTVGDDRARTIDMPFQSCCSGSLVTHLYSMAHSDTEAICASCATLEPLTGPVDE